MELGDGTGSGMGTLLINVSLVNGPFKALSNWSLANEPRDSVSDDGECAAASLAALNPMAALVRLFC